MSYRTLNLGKTQETLATLVRRIEEPVAPDVRAEGQALAYRTVADGFSAT